MTKEERKKELKKLLFSITLALVFFLLEIFSPNMMSYFKDDKLPNITASLIVEDLDSVHIRYSFRLKNIGDVDIKNVNVAYISPVLFGIKYDTVAKIEYLAKNTTVSVYDVHSVIPFKIENKTFDITLLVWYETLNGQSSSNYKSQLIFAIPFSSLSQGQFDPTNIKTAQGIFNEDELSNYQNLLLERESGLAFFGFCENLLTPFGSKVLIKSSDKIVYYTPVTKKIFFEINWRKRRYVIEQDLPRTKNSCHDIAIWWSDISIGMKVDTLKMSISKKINVH